MARRAAAALCLLALVSLLSLVPFSPSSSGVRGPLSGGVPPSVPVAPTTTTASGVYSDEEERQVLQQRRKLQHTPLTDWLQGDVVNSGVEESSETALGIVPTISCPLVSCDWRGATLRLGWPVSKLNRQLTIPNFLLLLPLTYSLTHSLTHLQGFYREYGLNNLARPVGLKSQDGCTACPRGRYGSSTDLSASTCTAPCPKGRYGDSLGLPSLDDCQLCPEGKIGDVVGQTTSACSGACTDYNSITNSLYSDVRGITSYKQCKSCPPGFRAWQCTWKLVPRKGTYKSTTGRINELAHQYLSNGNDGTWEAKKMAGEYAGAWPTAGAYPESATKYPGNLPWNSNGPLELGAGKAWGSGETTGLNFDPAGIKRAKATLAPVP